MAATASARKSERIGRRGPPESTSAGFAAASSCWRRVSASAETPLWPARLRLNGPLAGESVGDRELGARLARDPLIGVEARERPAGPDIDEARRALELRASIGEVELLRNRRAPVLEEVGTERDDELRVAKGELRPRHAVRATIRLDDGAVGLEVDADVRPHAEAGEPRVEESREAARLVLIEENTVAGDAATPSVTELLADEGERRVPRDGLPRAVLLDHGATETIGIVETLKRRLSAGAERATVQWVRRIALELRRAAVARFGNDATQPAAHSRHVVA